MTDVRWGMLELRRLAVATAITAIVLATAPSAGAVAPETADTAEFRRAVEFRVEFGLDPSSDHVRAVQERGPSRSWGVPLTQPEEDELARRVRVADGLDDLRSALNNQPGFGGMFTDQAGGGIVHITSTAEAREAVEALSRQLAPPDAVVTFENASYDLQVLQEVRLDIRDMMIAGATTITSVSVDVIGNRVKVGLDPKAFDATKADHEQRFLGQPLEFVPRERALLAACTSQDSCWPPARGGITVKSPLVCTSAFVAKDGTNVFLITGGHCAGGPGILNKSFTHAGVIRGKNTRQAYKLPTSYADATAIDISNRAGSNLVYVNLATQRPMTSRKALNVGGVGDPVCGAGIVTDFFCGTIVDADVDYGSADGVLLLRQREASIQVSQGDSGGPVFYGNTAHGIITAVAGNEIPGHSPRAWTRLFYGQIRDVEIQLSVALILN